MKHLKMMAKQLEKKEFKHTPLHHKHPPWRVDVDGARHYTDGSGSYPSVTTVLGKLNEGKFDWWYEAIGHEKAQRITNQSAYRGSQIHKIAENYLLCRDMLAVDDEVGVFDVEGFSMYKSIHPIINKHIDNVMLVEGMLISHKLRVGGTVDLFAEWDGQPAVIDFKNARRAKTEDDVYEYFIQETIYALMIKEMFGISPKKIVTVMAVENGQPIVFVKDPLDYMADVKEVLDKYWSM